MLIFSSSFFFSHIFYFTERKRKGTIFVSYCCCCCISEMFVFKTRREFVIWHSSPNKTEKKKEKEGNMITSCIRTFLDWANGKEKKKEKRRASYYALPDFFFKKNKSGKTRCKIEVRSHESRKVGEKNRTIISNLGSCNRSIFSFFRYRERKRKEKKN